MHQLLHRTAGSKSSRRHPDPAPDANQVGQQNRRRGALIRVTNDVLSSSNFKGLKVLVLDCLNRNCAIPDDRFVELKRRLELNGSAPAITSAFEAWPAAPTNCTLFAT